MKPVFLFFLISLFLVPCLMGQRNSTNQEFQLDDVSNTAVEYNIQSDNEPEIVCANGGYTYSIWQDNRKNVGGVKWWDKDGIFEGTDLYFNRSTNGGVSWGTEFAISTFPLLAPPDYDNSIVCSSTGQRIYARWIGQKGYTLGVYVASSSNYGQSFLPEKCLSPNVYRGGEVCCSSNGTIVYISWEQESISKDKVQIYFSYTQDGGNTWSTPVAVTENLRGNSACCCSTDGRYFHISYTTSGVSPQQVYVRTWDRNKTGGAGWVAAEQQVSNETTIPEIIQLSSKCSADGKTVHIAWTPEDETKTYLKHRRYYYNGTTWMLDAGGVTQIADFLQDDDHVSMYVYGNSLCCLAFEGLKGGDPYSRIYTAKWNGASWNNVKITIGDNFRASKPDGLCGYQNSLRCVFKCTDMTKRENANKTGQSLHHRNSRTRTNSREESRISTSIWKSSSSDGGATWTDTGAVSSEIESPGNPSISWSPDGNTICAAWNDTRSREGKPKSWARKLLPSADADSSIISTKDCPDKSAYPAILRNGSDIYVAWHDTRNSTGNLYFRHSSDNGQNWGSIVRVNQSQSDAINTPPVMCRDIGDGTLYVAWHSEMSGSGIVVSSSTNGGTTWSGEEQVCGHMPKYKFPWQKPLHLAANGGIIHMAWGKSEEVYFSRKSGGTWSAPLCLSCKMGGETDLGNEGDFDSNDPVLFVDETTVWVAWSDEWMTGDQEGKGDIYVRKSTDSGANWATPVRIDRGNSGEFSSWNPQLAVANSNLYATWAEFETNTTGIYFNKFNGTWGTAKRIDSDSSDERQPDVPLIQAEGNAVYVAWVDFKEKTKDIYFNHSTDNGDNFQTSDVKLNSSDSIDRVFPDMAISGSNVWVTWMEEQNSKWHVSLNNSKDNGTTWSGSRIVNSNSGFQAILPKIVCDNNQAYIVWADNRNNTWNVYHRTMPVASIAIRDFDADGKSDILWRQTTGTAPGTNKIWIMDGSSVNQNVEVNKTGTDWSVAGIGDFDGDNKADVLWRLKNGSTMMWKMDGTTIANLYTLKYMDTDWKVAGIADFNGNGKSDILWYKANGSSATCKIWFMDGSNISEGNDIELVDSRWKVGGVGDFDGNGKKDILWRLDDYTNIVWLMDGETVKDAAIVEYKDSTWSIAGTGDFNGDGKTDVLWRSSTGTNTIWFMNGKTIGEQKNIDSLASTSKAVEIGDFNGDTKDDILWRASPKTIIWFMDGGIVTKKEDIATSMDTTWEVVGGKPISEGR